MLTLTLLRHAKSSWDDPALEDFDRPLAPRGEAAAPRMGRRMVKEKLQPDLILCSAAMRTRQTLALVLLEFGRPAPEIAYEDELYLAPPARLIERLRLVKPSLRHVMLVGHNPGLHALALELIGGGRRSAIVDLARKFPTAAVATIEFEDLSRWSELRAATGTLRLFLTPRSLE